MPLSLHAGCPTARRRCSSRPPRPTPPRPSAEARGSSEQGEAPPEPASAADVVAGVVGRRLDQLDATFLATLDGYIGGAGERGASEVAGAGCWLDGPPLGRGDRADCVWMPTR